MKRINDFEQNSEAWHEFRRGKVGGTRLKEMWSSKAWTKADIMEVFDEFGVEYNKKDTLAVLEQSLTPEMRMALISTAPKKMGFYELLAEVLGLDPDDENRMDRGLRLEQEAADKFEQETGKKLQTVGCWQSDEDPRIYNSPDREVVPATGKKIVEAVEIKCLSPARHLQAVVEDRVPDEFESQKVQYFVVNPDLQTLYFVFYDPRIPSVPFKVVTVTRESLGNKPQEYLEFQKVQLADIDRIVEELSF